VVQQGVKRARLKLTLPEGLHARPAAQLVAAALRFRSRIRLCLGDRVADLRSILAVLMLGASVGALLDLEVSGDDEDTALAAITQTFVDDQLGEVLDESSDLMGNRLRT